MVVEKILKALRGSGALTDACAIDAAIDRGAGLYCANYDSQSALSGSFCLFSIWEHDKRGRTPSIFVCRCLGWLIHRVLLWTSFFMVKFAAAIAATHSRTILCLYLMPFILVLMT